MRTYFALLSILVGCTSDDGSSGNTSVSGQAVYRDATTDHTGAQRAPSAPPAQSAKVTMTIKGTGQTPELDPRCLTDSGKFEAHYAGNASLDSGGAYVSQFASGQIQTPSGCEIPKLTVGVVTDVVVRAELTTTTQNCQTYCEANARADAEAQCGATSSAASCRESAEASGTASCMTTCTSQKTKIVAETSIGVSSLGQVSADQLRSATFADLEGKLVFTKLE